MKEFTVPTQGVRIRILARGTNTPFIPVGQCGQLTRVEDGKWWALMDKWGEIFIGEFGIDFEVIL